MHFKSAAENPDQPNPTEYRTRQGDALTVFEAKVYAQQDGKCHENNPQEHHGDDQRPANPPHMRLWQQ
jgi:hypothetical protein